MKIYQVDAFSSKIFRGNPAGVCILPSPAEEEWMQNVAMEMNLPETAFLYKCDAGFDLRWFTPEAEVDLCGHATLAAAHILWEKGIVDPPDKIEFFTKSGRLVAYRNGEIIILDFPAEEDEPAGIPLLLKDALGVPVVYAGRNRMDYIIEVQNEEIVRSLIPDFGMMKKIDARGIIVTSISSNPEYDFVSRFFAPAVGIPEDPVTGSAHCCLGPYWKKRIGRPELYAYQASKRGGELTLKVDDGRVHIGGKAVTVFCADLTDL